jgi:hypothetical protein
MIDDEERYRLDRITLIVKIISCMHSATKIKKKFNINDGDGAKELHKICILQTDLNETIQKLCMVIDFNVNIRTQEDRWKMGEILNILQAVERMDIDFNDRGCLTCDEVWNLMNHADQWYSIITETEHADLFKRVIVRNALSFKETIRVVVGIDDNDDSSMVRKQLISSVERCKKGHIDTVSPYGPTLAYIDQILPFVKARVETRMDPNVSNTELNELIESALEGFVDSFE